MYFLLIVGEHSFFQVRTYGTEQIVTIFLDFHSRFKIIGPRGTIDVPPKTFNVKNYFMMWMNFEPGMIPIPSSHDASIETQEFMGAIIGDVYYCKSTQAELRGKISSCTQSHLISSHLFNYTYIIYKTGRPMAICAQLYPLPCFA